MDEEQHNKSFESENTIPTEDNRIEKWFQIYNICPDFFAEMLNDIIDDLYDNLHLDFDEKIGEKLDALRHHQFSYTFKESNEFDNLTRVIDERFPHRRSETSFTLGINNREEMFEIGFLFDMDDKYSHMFPRNHLLGAIHFENNHLAFTPINLKTLEHTPITSSCGPISKLILFKKDLDGTIISAKSLDSSPIIGDIKKINVPIGVFAPFYYGFGAPYEDKAYVGIITSDNILNSCIIVDGFCPIPLFQPSCDSYENYDFFCRILITSYVCNRLKMGKEYSFLYYDSIIQDIKKHIDSIDIESILSSLDISFTRHTGTRGRHEYDYYEYYDEIISFNNSKYDNDIYFKIIKNKIRNGIYHPMRDNTLSDDDRRKQYPLHQEVFLHGDKLEKAKQKIKQIYSKMEHFGQLSFEFLKRYIWTHYPTDNYEKGPLYSRLADYTYKILMEAYHLQEVYSYNENPQNKYNEKLRISDFNLFLEENTICHMNKNCRSDYIIKLSQIR